MRVCVFVNEFHNKLLVNGGVVLLIQFSALILNLIFRRVLIPMKKWWSITIFFLGICCWIFSTVILDCFLIGSSQSYIMDHIINTFEWYCLFNKMCQIKRYNASFFASIFLLWNGTCSCILTEKIMHEIGPHTIFQNSQKSPII